MNVINKINILQDTSIMDQDQF